MQSLIATLSPTDSAVPLRIAEAIAGAFPQRECKPFTGLDIDTFESRGLCRVSWRPSPTLAQVFYWGGVDNDCLLHEVAVGLANIEWQGQRFELARFNWREGYQSRSQSWLIGDDASAIDAFALTIYRVTNTPHEAVLVFANGCWNENTDLYRSIQTASFDALVLDSRLVVEMRAEFRAFLEMRAEYEALELPWRRGALFVGPPGNGKTQCLRALARELDVPTLYVQSLKAEYQREDAMIVQVFQRARQLQPCLLVFEDIDALITPSNRSVFLNQMDGFERNVGLIVIGTTNHPERLDPSLVDRPSRFDRKYHFPLPTAELRAIYVGIWRRKLANRVEITQATAAQIVDQSDGFSFAYLQELFVSALMRFVGNQSEDIDRSLKDCLVVLREQMQTGRDLLYPEPPGGGQGSEFEGEE